MDEGRECAGLAQVREQLRQMAEVPGLLTRILERIAAIEARLTASQGWDDRLRAIETAQAISGKDREDLHRDFEAFKGSITWAVRLVVGAALVATGTSVWSLIVSHAPQVAK